MAGFATIGQVLGKMMPRWTFYTLVFLVGVALSAVTMYVVQTRDRDLTVSRGAVVISPSAREKDRFVSAASSTPIVARQSSVFINSGADPTAEGAAYAPVDEPLLRDELARGVGHERLQRALESEDIRSLQLLRSGFVESVPNHQSVLMPLLREWVMRRLVSTMEPSDWANWPSAMRAQKGRPSQAREFVNQILIVNRDLGGYLETAAWLLYALKGATERGEVYDVRQGLKDLLRNAEQVALETGRRGQPAPILAPLIILDPAFTSIFEQERCRVVSAAFSGISSLQARLELISSLDARYCDPNSFSIVAESVRVLTEKGSPVLRAQFLQNEVKARSIDVFARRDDRVRTALAELYAVGSVDQLEGGHPSRARRYLAESIGLRPGLRSQESLKNYFANSSDSSRTVEEPEIVGATASTPGSTSWFFTLMFFAIIGVPIYYIFKRLRSSAARMGSVKHDSLGVPPSSGSKLQLEVENSGTPTGASYPDVVEENQKRRAQDAIIH